MNKKYLNAAQGISKELPEYGAKLVLLIGSVYGEKENPNDLDLGCIFAKENPLRNEDFRKSIINKMDEKYKIKLDLIDINEGFVEDLIKLFNENPQDLIYDLCWKVQDSAKDQWHGWPLAWILGENAKEKLHPYKMFEEGFKILYGQEYLTGLRKKIL